MGGPTNKENYQNQLSDWEVECVNLIPFNLLTEFLLICRVLLMTKTKA